MLFVLLLACQSETPKQSIEVKEQTITSYAKNMDFEQQRISEIIENNLKSMEIPNNIIAAAIVNGVAESKLDSNAIGDNGKSIGVFQLHNNGLGNKISPYYRKNVHVNSSVVAIQILKNKRLFDKDKHKASISELTAIIAKDIMRPDNIETQIIIRNNLAKAIFPDRI